MGIKMMAMTLAILGVLGGSAIGGTVAASPANVTNPPKIEIAYARDQTRDQLKIQDCDVSLNYSQDQLMVQDQDQLRTEDQIRISR